ncbi:hypothetical protein HOD29_01520 [archaeon]|jgi:hypothetical protein|nr:hypothetical protein [archaeon]
MSKLIAEFIGIMLGDGNLGIYKSIVKGKIKKQHRIRISLDSRNERYTDYVSKLLEEIFDQKPKRYYKKKENAVDLGLFRKGHYFRVIEEFGLSNSPKWNRMEIPKRYFKEKFYPPILKGLFDTDGCLSLFNNNGVIYPRIEIKICPSPAQNQFIKIVKNLGFRFTVQDIGKEKIRIRISGMKELEKWFEIVGSSNPTHIEKYKRITQN